MDALVPQSRYLLMKQIKEGAEIVLGWNTRNRYQISTETGAPLGTAVEESRGMSASLLRNFMGSMRACRIVFSDRSGQEVGSATKPFRFYFHHLDVEEGGRNLGSIDRRFAWLTAHLEVRDAAGTLRARIQGKGLRIWTYHVTDAATGQEIATIKKKWGGALSEIFTQADNFGIEFLDPNADAGLRKLLLAAVLLLDLVAFEQR